MYPVVLLLALLWQTAEIRHKSGTNRYYSSLFHAPTPNNSYESEPPNFADTGCPEFLRGWADGEEVSTEGMAIDIRISSEFNCKFPTDESLQGLPLSRLFSS